jgi:hypothetical protein
MTALEVLASLEVAGVQLSLNEGRIRLDNGVPPRLSYRVDELRKVREQAVAVLVSRRMAFESWLRESCVGLSRVDTNARILYREYRNALRETAVNYPELIKQLEANGYTHQDGMIAGLMLATDFRDLAEAERSARSNPGTRISEPKGEGNLRVTPKSCYVHGEHSEWWKRRDGSEVCGICHPSPSWDARENKRRPGASLLPENFVDNPE